MSRGVERNRMLGGIWLVSDFEGSFGDASFRGHGVYGYDSEKQKYVGTWVDTMNTTPMVMEGAYNEATKEMVFESESPDPSGQVYETRSATTHRDDGTRVFTMSMRPKGEDGDYLTMMEITYTRRPGEDLKKDRAKKAAKVENED